MATVLLVDDDVLFRTVVRDTLERDRPHGVTAVVEAGTAEEALAWLGAAQDAQDEEPFLLTDYRLPGMNGMELVGQVRRSHPQVRAVVWTSHSDLLDRSIGMAQGAGSVESKPLTPEGLVLSLANLLAPPRVGSYEIA